MKRIIIYLFVAIALTSCGKKRAEGVIVYQLTYHLPDSLRSYSAYLPATATVYFKGDSTATVQGTDQESTTMITYQPGAFMLSLLKSGFKRFQIVYSKTDQQKELPDMSVYEFTKGSDTKTIADCKAQQYIVKNKFSGDTTIAWFTTDVIIPQNFLTKPFNPEFGVPLSFSTNQNGFVTRATIKEIRFEPAPAGIFSIPQGYQKLTPRQLSEMPLDN